MPTKFNFPFHNSVGTAFVIPERIRRNSPYSPSIIPMDKTNLVTVKKSKHGKGIFATTNFLKGDIIFKITGQPLDFHQTLDLGEDECYCLQVGKNNYIIPDAPFHLSNHSCMPNCGINENMDLIALREIGKSEELLWDYSTSMLERHWVMKCKCGSVNCRDMIRDFDLLPLSLQKEYIDIGIVMPYILKVFHSEPVENDISEKSFI